MADKDQIPADGSPVPGDAGGAAPAGGADSGAVDHGGAAAAPPDDNFTPEERQQFEEMQREDADAGDAGAAPAAGAADPGADAAAAAAAAAAGAGDATDDDDDDEPAAGAAADGKPGADGKPFNPRKARVSRKKFETAEAGRVALEQELRTERDKAARGDERLRILAEALRTPKGQQQDDDPEPDKEADIFGHNAWLSRQLAKTNDRLNRYESGQQAKDQDTSLSTAYMDDARAFAAKEPNFVPAYQALMQSRTAEMALYWFGKDVSDPAVVLSPAEVNQIKAGVAEEEKQLAAAALKAGQSPAQRVFMLAKARGWKPPAAAANGAGAAADGAAPAGGQQRPTAQAAPPGGLQNGAAPANGKQPSVKDEIERIQNGQAASLSLSSGGGAPNSPLTAAKLADMPQDEFNRLVDTLTPEEFQRLVEGSA